jgi:hypothetical protein
VDSNRLGTYGSQCLLQDPLHSPRCGLNLPTLKMSASIGDNQF